jgi:hypothetical protein
VANGFLCGDMRDGIFVYYLDYFHFREGGGVAKGTYSTIELRSTKRQIF